MINVLDFRFVELDSSLGMAIGSLLNFVSCRSEINVFLSSFWHWRVTHSKDRNDLPAFLSLLVRLFRDRILTRVLEKEAVHRKLSSWRSLAFKDLNYPNFNY